MSSNKKFRVQNGTDITGEVVVGGQLVIESDGSVTPASASDAIASAFVSETSSIQSQVDAIIGTSADNLNTLEEIIAEIQSDDNEVSSLLTTNSTSISTQQSEISQKANSSEVAALSTSISSVSTLVSGASNSGVSSNPVVYVKSPDTSGGTGYGQPKGRVIAVDTVTGNEVFRIDSPVPSPDYNSGDFGAHVIYNDTYIATAHAGEGKVYVYTKDANGSPTGSPTILTSPSSSMSSSSPAYFGGLENGMAFVGDYLFVGESRYYVANTISHGEVYIGRVCVFDATNAFSFVKEYITDITDTTWNQSGLGERIISSGDYAIFGIWQGDKYPVSQNNGPTGISSQLWFVDTNNINNAPVQITNPNGIDSSYPYAAMKFASHFVANDTHILTTVDPEFAYGGSQTPTTAYVYETSTQSLTTHTSLDLGTDWDKSVSNTHAAFKKTSPVDYTQTVRIYSMPNLTYVGEVTKLANQFDITSVSLSGNKLSVSTLLQDVVTSDVEKAILIYDLSSSLTNPDIIIRNPVGDIQGSSAGVSNITAPSLSTTATTIVSAVNEVHTGFSTIAGAPTISFNALTGSIAVDESKVAETLHVATSENSNNLGGQSGSHYRLNVFSEDGTMVN